MREINRILCPVDLTVVSRDAIAHAVLLAGWYKAKITALHVRNPLVVPETDARRARFSRYESKRDGVLKVALYPEKTRHHRRMLEALGAGALDEQYG